MSLDERTTTSRPGGGMGFVAAFGVNAIVALAFWLAGISRYGYSGTNSLAFHYEEWLWPVGVFLFVLAAVGLGFLAFRDWRRFGAGLVAGVVLVGLLDCVWSFVYFVSLGS